MINKGIDVNVVLPILSTYMGHKTIASTSYYIQLTSKLYPDIIIDSKQTSNLFPKLNNDEEN